MLEHLREGDEVMVWKLEGLLLGRTVLAGLYKVLHRSDVQVCAKGRNALLDQLDGIKLDLIDGLVVDTIPEFLELFLEGERAAARAQLTPALDAPWWDNTKAEDIVRIHQTPTAWKGQDPMAHSAADAIREQVQQRYGIDIDALGTGADGATALDEAARAKTHAQEERTTATGENAQAAQFPAEAERADKVQRQNVETDNAQPEQLTDEATATYDSAERREALANSLDHIGDREAVEARLTADRNQAAPPSAAVAAGIVRHPRPATRTAAVATKQAQKGLSR